MNTTTEITATQVDSDVTIDRDPAKVDCYSITPAQGTTGAFEPETAVVPSTVLITLAVAVRHRGGARVLKALQDLRDFQDFED